MKKPTTEDELENAMDALEAIEDARWRELNGIVVRGAPGVDECLYRGRVVRARYDISNPCRVTENDPDSEEWTGA